MWYSIFITCCDFCCHQIESDLNYYLVKLWFLFYCLSECYLNAYLVRNCLYLVDIVLPNQSINQSINQSSSALYGDHMMSVVVNLSHFRLLELFWQNLTGSKNSTSSTKFVFFGAVWTTKIAILASDWLRHFWFFHFDHFTEFDETYRKQVLNMLYQLSVFLWVDMPTKVANDTQVHGISPFWHLAHIRTN